MVPMSDIDDGLSRRTVELVMARGRVAVVTAPPEKAAALRVRLTTWLEPLSKSADVSVEPVAGTVGNSRIPLTPTLVVPI